MTTQIDKELLETIIYLLSMGFEFEGDVYGHSNNLAVDTLSILEYKLKEFSKC